MSRARSRRWALACVTLLGLTSTATRAAPADPSALDPAASEPPSKPPGQPPSESPGALKVMTTAVSIQIRAEPLDREAPVIDLGTPPINVPLRAGRYRIDTQGPGYRAWSRDIEILAGQPLELQVDPELISGARLELRSSDAETEGAMVWLDGVELCELPCRVEIEAGAHQLEIRKRRRRSLSFPINVVQADEVVIDVTLEPAISRAPAILTGAIALSSFGAAVVFSVRADQTRRSLASDLEGSGQYDQQDRRIENGRRDAIIAGAMFGVTAAVGALTLYYLLRQPGLASRADKRQRSLAKLRWQLAPSVGVTGGGVIGTVDF